MDKKDMRPVATKVSPEAFARLNSICQERGITLYNMLQMFCDCMIRYMDSEVNLSEQLAEVIRLFEGMRAWPNANNLVDPINECGIDTAFYILRREHKAGERVAMVTQTFDGPKETYNIQDIADRFIKAANPSLAKNLEAIAPELETNGALETIYRLVNLYREDPDEQELRQQFEDNDWVGNAQRTSGVRYQPHNAHTMSLFEQ